MAVLTVTTDQDVVDANDGLLSLREAIQSASHDSTADNIRFAPELEGRTLTLTGGELEIDRDLLLDGDWDDDGVGVTLSGGSASRIASIVGRGAEVGLEDLAIVDGVVTDENGGALHLGQGGVLTLVGCDLRNNTVLLQDELQADGGALYAATGSRLTIVDTMLAENFCYGAGGGVATGANVKLAVRDSELIDNGAYTLGGALAVTNGSRLLMERSNVSGNGAGNFYDGGGGGIAVEDASAVIRASSIGDNVGREYGGGIEISYGSVVLDNTTVAANSVRSRYGQGQGGGIYSRGGSELTLVSSTVTGNFANYYGTYGSADAGAGIVSSGRLDLANTIVAGNISGYESRLSPNRFADDIKGTITNSNGHNLFGSDAVGDVAGDRENVDPATIFAGIDPATEGGVLALFGGPTPSVALLDDASNPALGGADQLDAGAFDQRGVERPSPDRTQPDIGAFELEDDVPSPRSIGSNNLVIGTPAADTLEGLSGNDLVRGLEGGDLLLGKDGSDRLEGGHGDDYIEGGTGNDALFGGEGGDRLLGEAGDDRLDGGDGSDKLEGGEGNDRLQGGAESDTIDGGSGSHDLASWWRDGGPTGGGVVADLSIGTAERGAGEADLLTAIEDLRGTDASDTLRGDESANTLLGMSGDDRLFGLDDADTLDGGKGSDLLDGGAGQRDLVSFAGGGPAATVDLAAGLATQGSDTDLLVGIEGALGSDFNDTLLGDAAGNELRGLGGNDLLYGGLGADSLTGGIGRDRFDYDTVAESQAGPARDVITDFVWNFSDFVDRIDLADIDARSATPADDAFTFIDTASFTDAGQLRWHSMEDGMVVEANTGGSLASDLEIELAGTFVIDADSFVL